MLHLAVGEDGTGFRARIPGYEIGGKTGTAQKVDAVAGGYSADRFVAAFVGVAPIEQPRIVVVIIVDEPSGEHAGGVVAAPVFAEIAYAALGHLGVLPSKLATDDVDGAIARMRAISDDVTPALDAPEPMQGDVPSFLGLTARQALERFVALRSGMELAMTGSGRVVKQDPLPSARSNGSRRLTLTLADSRVALAANSPPRGATP
jgi:cell division protein FtsI (penicillin-binding protein 3)